MINILEKQVTGYYTVLGQQRRPCAGNICVQFRLPKRGRLGFKRTVINRGSEESLIKL